MVSKKILHKTVCVAGLGYVGLPLAEAFSRHIRTIAYLIDPFLKEQAHVIVQ